MKRRILIISSLVLLFHTAYSQAQNSSSESRSAFERMIEVSNKRQELREKQQEQAANQDKLEAEVSAQREMIRQNPKSFPRQRYSYEAVIDENPWARMHKKGQIKVEIFVADKCPDCEQMEKFLDDAAVPYSRIFLTPGSLEEERYLSQIGRGILPVTKINRQIVRGYQPDNVRKMIVEEKKASPHF